MLTYFTVGPNEDQCYLVAYMIPGTKVANVALEHLTEKSAIAEAATLNAEQRKREAAIKRERLLLDRNAMSNDLGGANVR